MMADEQIEFASKDVFVLLDVPETKNLEIGNKSQDKNSDSKDDDNDSQFSLDNDEKLLCNAINEPIFIDVALPEELDYSSSDSLTKSELEEKRWYNPKLSTGLEISDSDSLRAILECIKNTTPSETLSALVKLRSSNILDESFQNMFIALNGFEVLINLLECNNHSCMTEALMIIHEMAPHYGIQCTLCYLDAIKPLLGILLFKTSVNLQFLAADTLQNISNLRIGRKLIRLSGGIRILAKILAGSKSAILKKNDPNNIYGTKIKLARSCADTLRLLCRSLKSQGELWDTGFIQHLPDLLNAKHINIQVSIMSLISECCRSRPNVENQKMDKLFNIALKELNILPKIIRLMLSSDTKLAAKAAETTLGMFDGDNYVYETLLEHNRLSIIFDAIKKFKNEEHVMVLVTTVLWKSSLDKRCRKVIEKDGIVNFLLELLTYRFNDRAVGYTIATLSELWKCESLQPRLVQIALPKYLELLNSSLHSLVLAHVCTALARMSKHPDCMKVIDKANGFGLVFKLLPSQGVDEFNKYEDFHEPETIIAAIECLIEMINNTPLDHNNLKGMYEALVDLVNLLTHKNLDILAAVCRLIDVIALHKENIKIMVDVGVIENLANLITTTHTNLKANLCRALGKCCVGGVLGREPSCKNLVDQLWGYVFSDQQIVKDNVPLALSGLSEDPINCIKIEALGFLPFLKKAVESNNPTTALAAVNCLRNVRRTCSSIGKYSELMMKK